MARSIVPLRPELFAAVFVATYTTPTIANYKDAMHVETLGWSSNQSLVTRIELRYLTGDENTPLELLQNLAQSLQRTVCNPELLGLNSRTQLLQQYCGTFPQRRQLRQIRRVSITLL
jgi:hypothetical protein